MRIFIGHIIVMALGMTITVHGLQSSEDTQVIKVKVHPYSLIQSSHATLGAISEIETPDPALTDSLNRIKLSRNPVIGSKSKVDVEEIKSLLRQNGIETKDVAIVCPRIALVERAGVSIDLDEINREIRKKILTLCPFKNGKVLISDFQTSLKDLTIPAGDISYTVDVRGRSSWIGSFPVSVTIFLNQGFYRKIQGFVKMDVALRALQASKPIVRGEQLKESSVREVESKMSQLRGKVLIGTAGINEYMASRNINPGEIITSSMLARPVLVETGQVVIMFVENGPMRITTKGIARSRGGKGDMIRVVNLSSKKEVQAQIVGKNLARVLY